MSTLASALNGLRNPKKGPVCTTGYLLEQVAKTDPAGHQALAESIDDHAIAATVIARALHEAGHQVSVHSIRRHRKRGTPEGCVCS